MDIGKLINLIIEGLQIEGEHHKQWYLEEILRAIGCDPVKMREFHDEWEKGVAP